MLVVHLQDSLAVAEAIGVGLVEYVERGVLSLRRPRCATLRLRALVVAGDHALLRRLLRWLRCPWVLI